MNEKISTRSFLQEPVKMSDVNTALSSFNNMK